MKHLKTTSIYLLLLLTSILAVSQNNSQKNNEPRYFVKNLSVDLHPFNIHSGSRISSDGNTLFFFIDDHDNEDHKHGQEIAFAKKEENGKWSSAQLVNELNNRSDNGVHFVSNDGNRVLLLSKYLSQGNSIHGVSMSHKKNNGEWSKPHHLKIKGYKNTDACSFHMNKDENILLLAIDNKDSYGEQDMYVSFKKDHNKWSKPVNLGPNINTEGSEGTMMLAEDGKTLYFSTDGRKDGMGGYDIYKTTRLDDTWTNWSTPENLGYPFNSVHQDLYYSSSPNDDFTYISRNITDEDGYQHSDIIAIKPMNNEELSEIIKKKSAKDFFTKKVIVQHKNAFKEKLETAEVGLSFELKNIFFEFNKAELKTSSYTTLEDLVAILKEKKDLVIEISGHTDNRGQGYYNLNLSQKRAQSVANYLIINGIDSARLIAIGYGEDKPLNNCLDCGEEDHQLNRRVELKIISN